MGKITELTPKYDFKSDCVVVAVGDIFTLTLPRDKAESLFESLKVGLYEASLYDSYVKKIDERQKEKDCLDSGS